MSMRPVELIRRSERYLAAHGVQSPRETAETLLMHVLQTDRAGLYARTDGLDLATARRFGRALCLRCKGTPLQHLTSEQQFIDLRLEVEPGVFIPRPETEIVVEVALDAVRGRPSPMVVDVGTGTGAIALAIAGARPDARVLATDVSEAAVRLARRNARHLGLAVEVLQGDLLGPVPFDTRGHVDLIVSNPPYVDPQEYASLPREVRADPFEAVVGGTQLHRRLAREATQWLAPGGWLVMEIGADQGPEVRALVGERLADVEVLPDLTGRDRVVRGRRPPS
jgi:release factor glutamine methyltransferase